jgi:hypothetical protein
MPHTPSHFKPLTIVAIAVVVAVAGCDRSEPARAAAPRSVSTPVDTNAAVPVATAGRTSDAPAPAPSGWREITLPAGTRLPVVLETTVGSDTSRVEQPVRARLARAVSVRGDTVLPAGSRVSGVVTDATRSGKVKGRAHVAMRFTTLVPQGEETSDARYTIETATIGRTAPATKKKDALEIGGGGAGGAPIGALVGGKKGALVGTAVGGGAGTAVVLSTRGKEVRFAKGAVLTLTLKRPVTVRVRQRE